MIVDAKYKRLEQGPVRDDLYQIISYMHTMRISVGGFLYPSPSKEVSAPINGVERKVYQLAGYGGTISSLGLPILQNAATYATFTFAMADRERELLEAIEEMQREGMSFRKLSISEADCFIAGPPFPPSPSVCTIFQFDCILQIGALI